MLCLVVVLVAAFASSASAQTPTTLSFYEPATGGEFAIVDIGPKSPVKNPESSKYRFSLGDELVFNQRLLNQKGGTQVGNVYARFTVVKGKTFGSLVVAADGAFVLNNGDQIAVYGIFKFSSADVRLAITGGTGAYATARGSFTSHNNTDDSSQDTLTLLP